MSTSNGPGFGLYIHWPFCESKCPYCDFNSHAASETNQKRWLAAYKTELDSSAQAILSDGNALPRITSIFFGGGTPSLMDPDTVDGILDAITSTFPIADNVEITLEANPSSAEADRFREYADTGINRVSIGVQSLHNDQLSALGRAHDRDAALATIAVARDIFPRFSFDLIYARPGQTEAEWEAELSEAIDLAGNHLSVYQLTIEPGTAFARNAVPAAPEELAEALYRLTQDVLSDAGLPAYEISNHASSGMESRHNMTYWRGGAYLGIGPGAHGRLQRKDGWRASYRIHDPERWINAVEASGDGTAKTLPLSQTDRRDESVMMGLRLINGLQKNDFEYATGLSFDESFDRDTLTRLINGGFLEHDTDTLKATLEGRLRLNAVIAALLTDE